MSTLGRPRCKNCGQLLADVSDDWARGKRCPDSDSGMHDFVFSGANEIPASTPTPDEQRAQSAPYQPSSIEWWIERVDRVVQECAQVGSEPILSKASVMAQLHTVQMLERLAVSMERRERAEIYRTAVLEKIAAALQGKEEQTLRERVRPETA